MFDTAGVLLGPGHSEEATFGGRTIYVESTAAKTIEESISSSIALVFTVLVLYSVIDRTMNNIKMPFI
jgi:hypothetical protein